MMNYLRWKALKMMAQKECSHFDFFCFTVSTPFIGLAKSEFSVLWTSWNSCPEQQIWRVLVINGTMWSDFVVIICTNLIIAIELSLYIIQRNLWGKWTHYTGRNIPCLYTLENHRCRKATPLFSVNKHASWWVWHSICPLGVKLCLL